MGEVTAGFKNLTDFLERMICALVNCVQQNLLDRQNVRYCDRDFCNDGVNSGIGCFEISKGPFYCSMPGTHLLTKITMNTILKLTLDWGKKNISVKLAPSHEQHLEIVLESVAHQLQGNLFIECQGRRLVHVVEDSSTIDISKIPSYVEEKQVLDVLRRIEDRIERTNVAPENLLHENEYFRCFRITSTDKQDLKEFFRPAFALEPLNTHLGLEGQKASMKFIDFVVDTYSNNELSIGVKDIRTGEVVAAIIPVDYLHTHDGQLDQFLEKECAVLLPIFHLIEQLHGQYFATRKKPTRPLEVVEIIAAAVHPLYYNRGLLNMICHWCLFNGKLKTPEDLKILLEPTGAFSQAAGIKIGGVQVSEILYSNFVLDGIRPFATVPKPHDRITLIELKVTTPIKPFTQRRNSNVDALLEEKFLRWTSRVASYVTAFDQNTLLQLYGYYKQATDGDNSTTKPWWFMFEARKKWNSWKSLKGTSCTDAMNKYIQLTKEKLREYY